jgi:hypothetical protein
MAEFSRFDSLRSRTEEQLIRLIKNELNRGIRDALQALRTAETGAFPEELYDRAHKAYDEVSRLIPLTAEMSEDERIDAESRLEGLRRMLESVLDSQTDSNSVCLAQ